MKLTDILHTLPDAAFEAGGEITQLLNDAGDDRSGRAYVEDMNLWNCTVAEFIESLEEEDMDPAGTEMRGTAPDSATLEARVAAHLAGEDVPWAWAIAWCRENRLSPYVVENWEAAKAAWTSNN